jgi:hypothetical protein
MVLDASGAWIEPSQAIGVEFGKPDPSLPVQNQLIRGAWQDLYLAWMRRINDGKPGEGIELIVSGGGDVVPKIVGMLFGTPGCIVWGGQGSHHPVASVRGNQLLKMDGVGVENGEEVCDPFRRTRSVLCYRWSGA